MEPVDTSLSEVTIWFSRGAFAEDDPALAFTLTFDGLLCTYRLLTFAQTKRPPADVSQK